MRYLKPTISFSKLHILTQPTNTTSVRSYPRDTFKSLLAQFEIRGFLLFGFIQLLTGLNLSILFSFIFQLLLSFLLGMSHRRRDIQRIMSTELTTEVVKEYGERPAAVYFNKHHHLLMCIELNTLWSLVKHSPSPHFSIQFPAPFCKRNLYRSIPHAVLCSDVNLAAVKLPRIQTDQNAELECMHGEIHELCSQVSTLIEQNVTLQITVETLTATFYVTLEHLKALQTPRQP